MRAILTLIAVSAALPASCGQPSANEGDGLTVVASAYPVAEAARRVGGDRISLVELAPPGIEPHDLELTPDDIEAVATADVVLYVGGGFQPAVEDAIGEASGATVDVAEGTATLAPGEGSPDEDERAGEASAADPHVWLDPTRYAAIVGTVADTFAAADPGSAGAFREGAEAYAAELDELDRAFREGLATCESRLLVVSHAAFGYLADAYDLEQEAISGVSPEAEPDPRRFAELGDIVATEGVTTIFVESLVSPAVGEALAEEAGVTTAVLSPLEGLTDAEVEAGDDYLSIMRTNLEVLRGGLRCA